LDGGGILRINEDNDNIRLLFSRHVNTVTVISETDEAESQTEAYKPTSESGRGGCRTSERIVSKQELGGSGKRLAVQVPICAQSGQHFPHPNL
jgi:hypothetical protein